MVEFRKLKDLIKLMTENNLSEIDLRDEHETVVLKRAVSLPSVPNGPAPPAQIGTPAAASGATDEDGSAAAVTGSDAALVAITSPMVGTFYSAPDPESPAYVAVGSKVSEETVVCVVEAMKVFSEIKAECSGTVEKILVKAAEPVEYGQKLFLVRPG